MKEIFEAVELELIIMNVDDVILTSRESGEGDDQFGPDGI